MAWLDLLIIGLASWRLASMLVHEDGPFDVFVKWRDFMIGEGEITGFGKLFSCVWCMAWWTSLLFYCIWVFWEPPVIIFAASAIAVLVEEITNARFNSN